MSVLSQRHTFILTPLPVFLFPLSERKVVFLARLIFSFAPFSSQDYTLSVFGSLAGHSQTVTEWLDVLLQSSYTLAKVHPETERYRVQMKREMF